MNLKELMSEAMEGVVASEGHALSAARQLQQTPNAFEGTPDLASKTAEEIAQLPLREEVVVKLRGSLSQVLLATLR